MERDGKGTEETIHAKRRKEGESIGQEIMAALRNATEHTRLLSAPTAAPGTWQPDASSPAHAWASMAEAAAAALYTLAGAGRRRHATGQRLLARIDGEWAEAEVVGHAAPEHLLRAADGTPRRVLLDPWNHAPLELPLATFDVLHTWWADALAAQHASIVDVISGRRLDVLSQCVAVTLDGVDAGAAQGADGVVTWVLGERACPTRRATPRSPRASSSPPAPRQARRHSRASS